MHQCTQAAQTGSITSSIQFMKELSLEHVGSLAVFKHTRLLAKWLLTKWFKSLVCTATRPRTDHGFVATPVRMSSLWKSARKRCGKEAVASAGATCEFAQCKFCSACGPTRDQCLQFAHTLRRRTTATAQRAIAEALVERELACASGPHAR